MWPVRAERAGRINEELKLTLVAQAAQSRGRRRAETEIKRCIPLRLIYNSARRMSEWRSL